MDIAAADDGALGRPDARPTRTSLGDLFSVPGYGWLFASSWLWHTTRWGGLFASTYLVTKLTDAPILNQLVGASIFAPMLLGGLAAGAISDRSDRRRLITTVQLALIPTSFAMFLLVQTGLVRVWMMFPFMLALGVGGVVNMTAQRALIYETVGPSRASRALAMETIAGSSSSISGALAGGALIGIVGVAGAFALLAVTLCLSAVMLRLVPGRGRPVPTGAASSIHDQVRATVRLLRGSSSWHSVLGVTIVFNCFYFAFIPLVPVMAERFGANAFLTGVLGAAPGCGQLLAGLILASLQVSRRGQVYAGGAAVALGCLGLFAFAPFLAIGFVALLLAGMGSGGFGSMQSLLVMETASDDERGAALGLLSTAIGVLPLGMVLLGVSAQVLGERLALLTSALVGLSLLAFLLSRRPDVLTRTSPPRHVLAATVDARLHES